MRDVAPSAERVGTAITMNCLHRASYIDTTMTRRVRQIEQPGSYRADAVWTLVDADLGTKM
jgi:hypothetical protein